MPFIRLLNISKHYSHKHGRFESTAFKPSSDGSGISVVKKECGEEHSGTICAHIAEHYPNVAGTPIVFWEIPDEQIPQSCSFVHSVSGTDQWCHYNLKDWDRTDAKKTMRELRIEDAKICADEGIRNLTQNDIP
ncbi:hypothetical protein BH10ACI2_BH10ACI2_16090 [soil metagenome]